MRFTHYVALGDSMSSDHYPTCDVRGVEFPPPRLDPLGAAALLHRNDDSRWEEFSGRDLATRCPGLSYTDLTEDGAYSLSDSTKKILAGLDERLLVRGYFSERTHPKLAPLVPQIRDLLDEYAAVGGSRVKV